MDYALNLTEDQRDDPGFVSRVGRLIAGAVAIHRPPEVRVFRIDRWFDHKWLAFSGKTLGAIGIRSKRPTVPPFVANRILEQWHHAYDENSGVYQFRGPGPNIHHRGWSAENLNRYVERVAPTSALLWYSGDTAATGRGSVMGYIPIEGEHWPWFLAWTRDPDWRVARRKGIHEYEVRRFLEASECAMCV